MLKLITLEKSETGGGMSIFEGQKVLVIKEPNIKRMYIGVNENLQVFVRINKNIKVTDDYIQSIVDRHKRTLKRRLKDYSCVETPNLKDGGKVRLLGEYYTVVCNEEVKKLATYGGYLLVPVTYTKRQMKAFLSKILSPYISELMQYYSKNYGLICSGVGYYANKTTWGTYYSKNDTIKFNVALAFLPKECVEYLVVHELCHTVHKNHSKAFWALVEKVYSNYKVSNHICDCYRIDKLFQIAKLGKWGV